MENDGQSITVSQWNKLRRPQFCLTYWDIIYASQVHELVGCKIRECRGGILCSHWVKDKITGASGGRDDGFS